MVAIPWLVAHFKSFLGLSCWFQSSWGIWCSSHVSNVHNKWQEYKLHKLGRYPVQCISWLLPSSTLASLEFSPDSTSASCQPYPNIPLTVAQIINSAGWMRRDWDGWLRLMTPCAQWLRTNKRKSTVEVHVQLHTSEILTSLDVQRTVPVFV